MARKKGNHELKRIEIADAACKAILRVGLANASLNDIARELGYTTGILRHYFHDKEQLLLFTKNYLFNSTFERERAAAAGAKGIDRLKAMGKELLPSDRQSVEQWRLLAAFNGRVIGNSDLMRRQHQRNAAHWAIYEAEIKQLQRDGVISRKRSAKLEACGILAFLEGLAYQVIMSPKTWRKDQLIELVDRYVDSMIGDKQ